MQTPLMQVPWFEHRFGHTLEKAKGQNKLEGGQNNTPS